MSDTPKTCLLCCHCYVDLGCSAYSEYTPGDPAEFKCWKGKWNFGRRDQMNREDLRVALATAENCNLFEPEKP